MFRFLSKKLLSKNFSSSSSGTKMPADIRGIIGKGNKSMVKQPSTQFEGCDNKHYLAILDRSKLPVKKDGQIKFYIQILAKVLGSEAEAKRRIYSVSCSYTYGKQTNKFYYGFGCEIDEKTSQKLSGEDCVLFVLADSYSDDPNKDYGGEKLINGELVTGWTAYDPTHGRW